MESVAISGVKEFGTTTLSVRQRAVDAVKRLQQQSFSQGKDQMTLEEINDEIRRARKQMNK
jgi:hypothetical protein